MGDQDYETLTSSPKVKKVLSTYGVGAEKILFSTKVVKINKRGKPQVRILMLTDKGLYNLTPGDYKCKRRVEVKNIEKIYSVKDSDEFVIKVPDEYDYRFKSDKRDEFIASLQSMASKSGKKIEKAAIDSKDVVETVKTKDKWRLKIVARGEKQTHIEDLGKEDLEEVASERDEKGGDDKVIDIMPIVGTTKSGKKEKVNVDSFDLLKVLGRGSFGKVMLVRHKVTKKVLAMKILKKNMVVARSQVEHTLAERKILQALQHPFLTGLRYAFQTPTKLYLVMDFYQGGELFFHLKTKRRFTEAEARFFVAEVALGLGHLHSLNFIYRDLKPENILMDEKGHVCLTDFGLSKNVDPENPEATTFCGTPEYLAPEILIGSGHGKAVDWWSLGILLYELTVGIPPFYSTNVNEMYHKIQHGKLRFPPFLSAECQDLIVQLLSRNPATRLGSSDDDVEEIKRHAFFAPLDFDKLMRKEIEPPYRPKLKTDDPSNPDFLMMFDKIFTDEKVADTPMDDPSILPDEEAFKGFTYVDLGPAIAAATK